MRFWDASALIPLLVREQASDTLRELYEDDPLNIVWWAAPVECASAIARRERDGTLTLTPATEALGRLAAIERTWYEVAPAAPLRASAQRLLRVHPLCAADALQLAAALAVGIEAPTMAMVCLDQRLREAAQREGLPVAGPAPRRRRPTRCSRA